MPAAAARRMILEHWSSESPSIDRARISGDGFRCRHKPNGFWVSVAGPHDWPAYLVGLRGTRGAVPAYRHRIELAPDARILTLDSAEAILAFSRDHGLASIHGTPVPPGDAIDWDLVEREWQGIIIAPYQPTLRRDPRTRWYYGWDCASGCIWDPAAILDISPAKDARR